MGQRSAMAEKVAEEVARAREFLDALSEGTPLPHALAAVVHASEASADGAMAALASCARARPTWVGVSLSTLPPASGVFQ